MTMRQRFALLVFVGGEMWVVIDVAGVKDPSPLSVVAAIIATAAAVLFVCGDHNAERGS